MTGKRQSKWYSYFHRHQRKLNSQWQLHGILNKQIEFSKRFSLNIYPNDPVSYDLPQTGRLLQSVCFKWKYPLPRKTTCFHYICQGDVIGPHVILPLAETKDSTQHSSSVQTHTHIEINFSGFGHRPEIDPRLLTIQWQYIVHKFTNSAWIGNRNEHVQS